MKKTRIVAICPPATKAGLQALADEKGVSLSTYMLLLLTQQVRTPMKIKVPRQVRP